MLSVEFHGMTLRFERRNKTCGLLKGNYKKGQRYIFLAIKIIILDSLSDELHSLLLRIGPKLHMLQEKAIKSTPHFLNLSLCTVKFETRE